MAMESDDKYLRPRYLSVLERLETAVCHSGRRKEDVTLVAVSKLHPASMVAAVCDLGQIDFGENYVQEAMEKRAEIEAMDRPRTIRWHMIGHVQSRKASIVAGAFDLIHSLDSIHLATALEKHCAVKNAKQKVLIEVNVGEEPQKTGVEMKDLDGLAADVIEKCPHLELQGLMCIPPVYNAGAAAWPYFARLRELRDKLSASTGLALPHLSMGMSGDFEWAIEEGATFVRVGTDIFGPRPPKKS